MKYERYQYSVNLTEKQQHRLMRWQNRAEQDVAVNCCYITYVYKRI
jgi:hypothetical protein